MVNVDEAFQIRYKFSGEEFQVLVDFNKLEEFKKKQDEISVYDVLADTKIFKDQKKGELASENILNKIFPSKTEEEILKEILLKGECQIPTAYLNKLREEKKIQVINYIVENAINAQTKSKFTPTMVESEVNKLKFNFDYRHNVQNQAEEIIKLLKKVMPISMEKIILEISIPAQYCGPFYGPFRKYGRVTKEYFDRDNNLRIHLEISETQIDQVANYIKTHSNGEGEYFVSKN
ncbi:MAG: ribosome assembly factor SBDS [Nanoarchaeota archaeon]|nr:ribosome assembly factor SBDS [Nanoarchaeota archaeon]